MSNVKIADQIRAKYIRNKHREIKGIWPFVREIVDVIIYIPDEATEREVNIILHCYDLIRSKERNLTQLHYKLSRAL